MCFLIQSYLYLRRGGREVIRRTEQGNRLIFSTEFGKMIHILADFGNRNTGGYGNIYIDSYLTGILKSLERHSEIVPLRNPLHIFDFALIVYFNCTIHLEKDFNIVLNVVRF